MESSDLRELTLTGVFIAIIAVMTFVPYTGYISYGAISITTMHIPVIIGAMVLGKEGGFLLGLTWGVLNLVKAYTSGDPDAVLFQDPLISVIPRVIDGFVVGFFADKFRGKLDIKKYSIICGMVGSLTNTVLVLSAIGLFGVGEFMKIGEVVDMIFQVLVGVNGIIELSLAIILTPILIQAISKVYPVNVKEF